MKIVRSFMDIFGIKNRGHVLIDYNTKQLQKLSKDERITLFFNCLDKINCEDYEIKAIARRVLNRIKRMEENEK